jgi:hypothetical protein
MEDSAEAPKKVKAKARLIECDLPAMTLLFDSEVPPKRLVRARKVVEVYYGFGDASQDGFSFNIQAADGITVHYRFGQWCDEVSEKESNYWELYNLVCQLEVRLRTDTCKARRCFCSLTILPQSQSTTREICLARSSMS